MTSLRGEDWTNSSLTLSWTAPQGPPHPPYTYSVSWVEEGTPASGTRHTLDTRVVLELEAGSLYTFTVWAERNGASSDNRTLTGATGEAPSSSGPALLGRGKGSWGDMGGLLGGDWCLVTLPSLAGPRACRSTS